MPTLLGGGISTLGRVPRGTRRTLLTTDSLTDLYEGQVMRPTTLPAGADPWTGEGFGTSRGSWRHAAAGMLMTSIMPIPTFGLGAILGMATQHRADLTVGRKRSAIRAAGESPTTARLVNTLTGREYRAPSTEDLIAEAEARRRRTATTTTRRVGERPTGTGGGGRWSRPEMGGGRRAAPRAGTRSVLP